MFDAPNRKYFAVAASSTGQYVMAGSSIATLVSSDYGEHFITAANITNSYHSVAVSGTGQYMVSIGNYGDLDAINCLSYSDDYGATFTSGLGPDTSEPTPAGVAIDSSGIVGVPSRIMVEMAAGPNDSDDAITPGIIAAIVIGLSSDSTGSYLTAVADVGPIYYSNDSGVSWKVSDAPRDYYLAVAASSTGQYVIAGSDSKTLVSSDYGQHFTAVTSKAAEHVAVSSTGQYMVSNTGGYTFSPNTCLSYSNNYGASFTTGLGPPNYNNRTACGGVGIDSSVVEDGPIYYSADGGVSWKISDAPNPHSYFAVAASSTGQYVIAGSSSATLVSSDYGQHFTTAAGVHNWYHSVGVSGTGQYMVSVDNYGVLNAINCLSYSNDYGATFTSGLGPDTNVPTPAAVAIDSSGTYVVLSVYPQGLWWR
eukprot:gene12898-biopygen2818